MFTETQSDLPTCSWCGDKKILTIRFTNCPNERIQKDINVIADAVSESSQPIVHFIGNYSDVTRIPGILAWARVRFPAWDRVGWVVIYGLKNQSLQLLLSYVAHLYSIKMHFCENEAQSLDFLQRVDQTLPLLRATSET